MSCAGHCSSTSRTTARLVEPRPAPRQPHENTPGYRVRERARNSVMARQSRSAPDGGASGMRVEYLSVAVIGWYGNLVGRP